MRRAAATTTCATFALAAAVLGGCGGGTKTVTVSGVPVDSGSAGTTATHTSSGTSTATPPATSTGSAGARSSTEASAGATRTAPEPAFAQHGGTGGGEPAGEEAAAAVAVVKTHGYIPNDVSQYRPKQTLRVLVGTRAGSADGYDQRAFFFLDGRYLGTDSSSSSASIEVVDQSDTEVVLAYPLYRSHDPLCCPSGGRSTVHFQLNDGKLVPLQPIPPASSASGFSRQ